jgi:hypothetical protein
LDALLYFYLGFACILDVFMRAAVVPEGTFLKENWYSPLRGLLKGVAFKDSSRGVSFLLTLGS